MKFEVGQVWLDGNGHQHTITRVGGAGTYSVQTNTNRSYTEAGVFDAVYPFGPGNLVRLHGVPPTEEKADQNAVAAETLEALGWTWDGQCWVESAVKRVISGTADDHPLKPVLDAAIHQAMYGKGERHGGATVPFLDQPIFHYAKMHGRGFLTGQAAKKLEEAASTRNGEAFEAEVLGAIVYAASAILHERAAK